MNFNHKLIIMRCLTKKTFPKEYLQYRGRDNFWNLVNKGYKVTFFPNINKS